MLLSSSGAGASFVRPTGMPSSAIAAAPAQLHPPQLAPACRRGAAGRLAQRCAATTTEHPAPSAAAPGGARGAPSASAAPPPPPASSSLDQVQRGGVEESRAPSVVVSSPAASHEELHGALRFTDLSTRIVLERLYYWDAPSASSGAGASSDATQSPLALAVSTEDKPSQREKNQDRSPDYFANVGDAIRTLREDIPQLFEREISYSIYREDIVFKDPRLTLEGIKNYKRLFWSLRASGRLFFSHIRVEVKRIWQPMDGVIKMRWCIVGVPRVPWDAEGFFDGISTYKLDHNGKVYEHSVDNVLLRDPPALAATSPLLSRINLVPNMQQPCPGACTASTDLRPEEQLPQASSLHHAPSAAVRRPRRSAASAHASTPASAQHAAAAPAAAQGGTPAAAELWAEAVRDVSLSFHSTSPAHCSTAAAVAAPPTPRRHHAAPAAAAPAALRRTQHDAARRASTSPPQQHTGTAHVPPKGSRAAARASKPAAAVAPAPSAAAQQQQQQQQQAKQGNAGGSGGAGAGSWSQQLAWERLQEALVAGADVAAGSLHAPGHSGPSALEPSPSH